MADPLARAGRRNTKEMRYYFKSTIFFVSA